MENLIKTNPESIIGYYYLGKIEAGRKHLDKAVEHYNKAIEINPSFQSAYAEIAKIHEVNNKIPEAIEAYQRRSR